MGVCRWRRASTRLVLPVAVTLVVGGCSEDATGPEEAPIVTHTVDASANWAFVELDEPVTTVTVTDAAASSAWDLGFFKTDVMVNGGDAGPGDIEVHCVCQNTGATDAQVMAMTADGELADFESVTAAQIPSSAAAWSTSAFSEDPWYRYNLTGNHQIWPTYQVYLVKRGSDVFKVQVINYYGPAAEPRQITFRSSRLAG